MPACPSCQQEVAPTANFCANCGEFLRKPADPALEAMMQDARRALARNPDDADAHYNLALAYKLTGAEELALRELRVVGALEPDFADAHYEAAAILARTGRKDEAAAALDRALAADPGHAQAKRLREQLP